MSAQLQTIYGCESCGWTGDNPAITERNVPTYDEAGGYSEQLQHSAVCRVCHKGGLDVTHIAGTNVIPIKRPAS